MTFPLPDAHGRFGPYGGRFVPETLMSALEELEAAYHAAQLDAAFAARDADRGPEPELSGPRPGGLLSGLQPLVIVD